MLSFFLQEMFEELAQELPSLIEPLIHERDRYLSYRLRMCCTQLFAQALRSGRDCSNLTVLTVVGMGHVRGIEKNFQNDLDKDDFVHISKLPVPKKSWITAQNVVVTLAFAGAGVYAWRKWMR